MAVEDGPRITPDTTSEKSDEVVENNRPKRESFLDSWQRFRDSFSESPIASFLSDKSEVKDKEPDEESDESDELSPVKKRKNRFRNALKGLIVPRPDTVVGDDNSTDVVEEKAKLSSFDKDDPRFYEEWSPAAQSEIVEDSYSLPRVESTADRLDDVEHTTLIPDHTEVDSSTETPKSQLETDSGSFMPHEVEGSIPLNSVDRTVVTQAQPESVQTILERQHMLNLGNTIGNSSSTDTEVGLSNHSYNRTNKDPAIAGLLALDVLNYGVAKRRDNKKEKASISRDKKIEQNLDKQQKEAKERMLQQQLYQKELAKRTERLEQDQKINRLPKVRQTDYRGPTIEPSKPNIDQKPEVKPAKLEPYVPVTESSKFVESSRIIPERHIVAAPDVAIPSSEAVLHKVEKAAEFNVPIESQYELRHENKGNTDYPITQSSSAAPIFSPIPAPTSTTDMHAPSKNVPATNITSQKPVLRQAAVTGAWGAIVGIILFIIFILLT